MVRIDGNLVRKLREEKGLTQLYLATAVEVTTDTISRWENKHYQSVKLENAQRLAEALDVELVTLLEAESGSPEITTPQESAPSGNNKLKFKVLLGVLLGGCLVILAALYYFFLSDNSASSVTLNATRKTPQHAMPGYPFPVVITVDTVAEPLSLVIKESLPSGVTVTSSSSNLQPMDRAELKWIVKHMKEQQRFGYMVMANGSENLHFHGTVTSRAGRGRMVVVGGRQSLAMAPYHWADSNQDGIIGDEEILVVYDDFEDVPGITVDVELVEDMWMGSGYRWDKEKKKFEVIP